MGLKLRSINKSFEKKHVIKNFSYTFPDFGIFALVGESGVGKTTLLRIISGLDKDYEGTVIGGGIENVSVMFQEYRLFPHLSAIKNITVVMGDENSRDLTAYAKEELFRFGFSESDMNLYPTELSGGMKQRVSFIRTISSQKPILLFDEPTKELDEIMRIKICERIKEESRKKLVIVISHNSDDLSFLNAIQIPL